MTMLLSPDELSDLDLEVHYLGGPDDPWLNEGRGDFPSTTTARANRYFAEHGKPMPIYSRGHLVIEFIEEDLVLGSGSYLGRPFKLMEWQKRMLIEMYEVTEQMAYDMDADEEIPKWMRRNKWAYIQLPKKNGKTEIAAGLGLYHLVAEEDSVAPNIVCAAASDEQADLVFGAATQMCRRGNIDSVTTTKHKVIQSSHNSGEFHRLAAASGTNDGKNISGTLIDELHEWVKPNARAIYDVITQGGAARPEFYNIMITTPGSEQDSIAYEFYEQVKDSIDGVKDDETLYGLVFETPLEADHTDPATWEAANPGYGKIVHKPFYEDMVTKRREAVFRRYFCPAPEEEVWMADGTRKKAQHLQVGDFLDNGRGGATKVLWVEHVKKTDRVRMHTQAGSYLVSAEHKALNVDIHRTGNQHNRVYEITEQNRNVKEMKRIRRAAPATRWGFDDDVELAWLAGALCGDGHVKNRRVQFVNLPGPALERVRSLWEERFGVSVGERQAGVSKARELTAKTIARGDHPVWDWASERDVKSGADLSKLTEAATAAWVAGLWDTDGTWGADCIITQKDKKVIRDVAQALSRLGIDYTLKDAKYSTVRIAASSLYRFNASIGQYMVSGKRGSLSSNRARAYDGTARVTSVDSADAGPVVAFGVDGDHLYTLGGTVHHNCGQWTETEEIWEAAALWDGLVDDQYKFDPEKPVYVGIDIGLKHDTTAVALVQWDNENERLLTHFRIWQNPHSKRTAAYTEWELDLAEVENYLREIRETYPVSAMEDPEDDYPVPGPGFFYDPHNFSRSAQMLRPDGLNMIEVPQTDTIMCPASQRIFVLIKEGKLAHQADPVVRKHVRSVVPLERERTWRISKTKSKNPIDAMVGLTMAGFYCTNVQGVSDEDDLPNIY